VSAPTHDLRLFLRAALRRRRASVIVVTAVLVGALLAPRAAAQQQWYVAPSGTGNGSSSAPFGKIQQAIQAAQPGDTVLVAPGTYAEGLTTYRAGASGAPITIKATGGARSALVTRAGRVLEVLHPYVVVDGLVLDGQYAATDAVRVSSAADHFTLRNAEVRRTSRDCIDIGGPDGVLIESTNINRCLWWSGVREDAHGIVAGAVHGLTIRNVQISAFSGDGIQLDPSRSLPGWDDVVVEGSTLSLAPLASAENGFAAGVVPGENGIDTKTHGSAPRASLVVRDTVAHGFRKGLIANMAAFNIKENVEATFDRVTVRDSLIAFRLRGPGSNGGAWVHLRNAVVHGVSYGIRYEDYIEQVEVSHVTFGASVGKPFEDANSNWAGIDVRNTLVLGSALPAEAPSSGANRAVSSSAFVNAAAHDYRLTPGSPAVDQGTSIAGITTDRVGTKRPQGAAPDLGAYELAAATSSTAPTLSGSLQSSDPTNAVRVAWTNVSGESGYEVERSSDGATFARVATRPADGTSWYNSALKSGSTYWYRVRAMYGTKAGAYSNVVALKLQAEGSVPTAPAGFAVKLSVSSTTTVVLTWQDSSLNEDGFYVERSTDGVAFSRLSTRKVNSTSYSNGGLTSGKKYWYRVRAFNSLGAGAATPVLAISAK
jgi:hypothetical protein